MEEKRRESGWTEPHWAVRLVIYAIVGLVITRVEAGVDHRPWLDVLRGDVFVWTAIIVPAEAFYRWRRGRRR
ncbi:hypothetical protein [Actinomadura parmotrematis]|uniref:Uncharacterized protein n=1 Tax=Actinomadura parmotrematis TaxID=2864039 RepID=A0ABS7G6C0_9ACTN|nr:hypothetical protein [Actinomadura parmotrematis]MBW8487178.1 hypothetical protein [Actinomadura parmotrematis]